MLVKWGTGRPAVGLLQACKCSTYPGPSDSTFVMPWIHLALSSPQNGQVDFKWEQVNMSRAHYFLDPIFGYSR